MAAPVFSKANCRQVQDDQDGTWRHEPGTGKECPDGLLRLDLVALGVWLLLQPAEAQCGKLIDNVDANSPQAGASAVSGVAFERKQARGPVVQ
jgi:hypothetical protein